MKALSKVEANARLAELSGERDAQALAIGALLADEITWLRHGPVLLGVCGELRACGGVVIVRFWDEDKRRFELSGTYYLEAWAARVRQSTSEHPEAVALRIAASNASNHARKAQSEFYAPRVAQATVGA